MNNSMSVHMPSARAVKTRLITGRRCLGNHLAETTIDQTVSDAALGPAKTVVQACVLVRTY